MGEHTERGRLFIGGERNWAAARDIHISASRSLFAQLAGEKTDKPRGRPLRRMAKAGSIAASCALDILLALLPAQPLLVALMLGIGASAVTLLAVALICPPPPR